MRKQNKNKTGELSKSTNGQ